MMIQTSTISVQELAKLQGQQNVDVIDVRTPVEFREVHAVMARNVPLDRCDPCAIMQQRNGSADQPLYVICKSGARAERARQRFADAGFDNVIKVVGGTDAWVAAGLPVNCGQRAVSLELPRSHGGGDWPAGAIAAADNRQCALGHYPGLHGDRSVSGGPDRLLHAGHAAGQNALEQPARCWHQLQVQLRSPARGTGSGSYVRQNVAVFSLSMH